MTKTTATVAPLPKGILKGDLERPKYDAADGQAYKTDGSWSPLTFELWFTSAAGWVIPTLLISRARRGSDVPDRYYAVDMLGKTWTVGRGPHVLKTVTVYVRKSRVDALKSFLDLKDSGNGNANMIRDRISTRRARTVQRRASMNSWLGYSY